MRNALAYVPEGQHTMVAAAIRQTFIQPDHDSAVQTWRHVADQLRARWPKLGGFMDDAEADVLAYMAFPAQHRTKLHSTNPLERLNKEVKRRADVVGIFPNEDSIVRLIGAVLLEANDEWQLQHHAGRGHGRPQPTSDRGGKDASDQTKGRLIMTARNHIRNYTTLTDATSSTRWNR